MPIDNGLFFYLCAIISIYMGFIDIVLGGLLLWGFIKGFRNGLFVELASLISLFIGIYLAVKFSYVVKSMMGTVVSWSPKAIQVTAFILTLLVVIVGIHLFAKLFTSLAGFAFLGWANSLGGAFLATLKTTLLLGTVLGLFQKVNLDHALISKETQEKSIFYNPVQKTSEVLLPSLTDWFKELKNKTTASNPQ